MSGEPRRPLSPELLALIRARIEARLAGPPEFETNPCRRCKGPVQSEMDVDLSLCTRCRDVLYIREFTVRCPRCKSTFLGTQIRPANPSPGGYLLPPAPCPYCGFDDNAPKGGPNHVG